MQIKKSHRLFLSISVVLMLSDLLLVVVSNYFSEQDLQRELTSQGEQYHAAYNLILREQFDSMLMLASSFARQERFQQLFQLGVEAVGAEGGGAGGEEAARLRQALYQEVAPTWNFLINHFDVRQLHFHLGPGSTSYLRVHRPERFGDNMDNVRHTIATANASGEPQTGFETGRVYSGIRGVVPMYSDNGPSAVQTGALEVGTSFQPLLETLESELDTHWAVLLTQEHVERNMWPDAIRRHFTPIDSECHCQLESTTHSDIRRLISANLLMGLREREGVRRAVLDGVEYAIHYWPLRDYLGERDPSRSAVGMVVTWKSIDARVANYREGRKVTLIYAIIAYLLVELMLYFTIRVGTRKLEQEVVERTSEVDHLNTLLRHQANTDELTGLSNRRHLMALMEHSYKRSHRSGLPLCLLILDLDHFKRVNDRHGHLAGDEVLRQVAQQVREGLRESDMCGRYGGEEFCIILPETASEGAFTVAEKLRIHVSQAAIQWMEQSIPITLSIGIAQWDGQESLNSWLARADSALYRAKEQGRNRTTCDPQRTQNPPPA